MIYQDLIIYIRNYILISEVMLFLATTLVVVSIFVAFRTRLWGLLMMAGGAFPVMIYYGYSVFGLWSSVAEAHVYGRLAYIALFVSLIASLRRIFRRHRYGN